MKSSEDKFPTHTHTHNHTITQSHYHNYSLYSLLQIIVKDKRGELVGIIYLDLFPRDGKFPGAANFPLKFWTHQSPFARVILVANIPDQSTKTK